MRCDHWNWILSFSKLLDGSTIPGSMSPLNLCSKWRREIGETMIRQLYFGICAVAVVCALPLTASSQEIDTVIPPPLLYLPPPPRDLEFRPFERIPVVPCKILAICSFSSDPQTPSRIGEPPAGSWIEIPMGTQPAECYDGKQCVPLAHLTCATNYQAQYSTLFLLSTPGNCGGPPTAMPKTK